MKVSGFLLLLSVLASCSGFYISAPDQRSGSPFCYINALSMSANNVLHWKILEPRPAKFNLYVTITDKYGNRIANGSSKLEEDTLAFEYKPKDVIRVCIESDQPEGLRVHVGYRLAVMETQGGKLATLKQADH
jgi:hypothetical protein